jgi:hypothetical protein
MSELEDFRAKTLARQAEAEEALVHGDVEPRLAMWSSRDQSACSVHWGQMRPVGMT